MSARFVLATLALSCATLASCSEELPPRGQVVLFVDTDAPVPGPRESPQDATKLAPIVDRVRFEILVDGKVLAGSSRDFSLDEASLRERRISFGILPAPNDAGVSVRVRMFRADRVRTTEPPAGVTLDTTVTLPAVGGEGITEVTAVLRTDDIGKKLGPLPAAPGRPGPSLVGTWRGGRRIPCGAPPGEGEVCVPGGAYFFGDPAFRGRTQANDIAEERLVWVSPFYLDRTEVVVGAFRARWAELAAAGARPPIPLATSRDTGRIDDYCPWTDQPAIVDGADLERRPLACLTWDTARAYCRLRGGDLPTEAQFEYAASGLGREWAHPWGDDEPSCTDAIWGRGGAGFYFEGSRACESPGLRGWAAFPGSGTRDRIDPTPEDGGDPEILDLGGNLAEWTLDMWSLASDPFWSASGPRVDPLATELGSDGDRRAVRGGSWPYTALLTRAAFRFRRRPDEPTADVGFRCARPITARTQ